jgi:hypothetical protein
MTLPTYLDASASPWAAAQPGGESSDPSIASAVEKEHIIKDILALRDGLRSLMVRVTEVENDNEKLNKDNEMLGIYIDNL